MTFPLTEYLVAMMKAPREALASADPAKLAAKYGVRADWARWYLEQWRARA